MTLHLVPVVYIGTPLDAAHQAECQVMSAQVHHGRDDAATQPLASTLTLELVDPLPASAVMGAAVTLGAQLDGAGAVYVRFAGAITDLEVGWDSVDVTRPRIIATGDLGRLGRRMVGDVPWAAELDGARVNRILGLAGFPPFPATLTDPGTVQLLARDVDRQPALTLAQEAADDGGGLVWANLAGMTLYADALHRRGSAIAFEFQACDIGLGLDWTLSPEGLVNDAYVRYGVAPEGGVQPEVHASDPASIDARGTYAASVATALATAVDAQRRADDLVARQSDPSWILGGLEVNLSALTLAEQTALLGLDMHSLVSVTGLPEGSPATSANVWVEGWRETIEALDDGTLSWIVAYATSDYCRTAAPPLWDDVQPAVTWDTVDPALTWQGAVCLPPAPSRGRWNDAPATLRWDQLAPGVTWDTWVY